MFDKEFVKNTKTEFWTSFGKYMRKYKGFEYKRVRWVNYRTGVKDVYFRLEATHEKATFSIDIQHKDDDIRELYYEQFLELKAALHSSLEMELEWIPLAYDEIGWPKCQLKDELEGVSIFNKDDWGSIFQFFEKRMVATHLFWVDFKEVFDQLD